MKSHRLSLKSLIVCVLFLTFLSIGSPRAHAQFRTDFSSCYTYDSTSGNTGQTTINLGSGKTVSVMNSSSGSIFQAFTFNASPTQNLYNYCSVNVFELPAFQTRVKLDFVTPQGGLLDFPNSSAWPVQGTSFWDYGSYSYIASATIPPAVDTLPNFNVYSNYLTKVTYAGLKDLSVPILNEDAIIDSVSQTGKINLRVSNSYQRPVPNDVPLFANVSAPATNCVKLSGGGPIKVVFMRGKSWNSSVNDFLLMTNNVIDGGFKSIDPLKSYISQFSFYVDLKKYDDSSFPIEYISGFGIGFQEGIATDSIKTGNSCNSFIGKDNQYIFFVNRADLFSDGYAFRNKGIAFFNLNGVGTRLQKVDIPPGIIHELGHSFAGLFDEYTQAKFGDISKLLNTTELANCTLKPKSDYLNSVDKRIYGSISEKGCTCVQTSSSPFCSTYYRPSQLSLMYVDQNPGSGVFIADHRFNIISCGYVIAAIKGESAVKANAQKYWSECLTMAMQTPPTVNSVGIPPVSPVPSVNSVRTTPKTSLNSSQSFFARLFDSVKYSLLAQVGGANNISLRAGDTITVSGSGFTATDNSAQLVNTTDSTKTYDIDSISSTDTFAMSFDVPTTTPPGAYYLKVGAFNSPWTSTVATVSVSACTSLACLSGPPIVLPPGAIPPPVVTLTATPTSITTGQSSTLSWSATNATSCTASGAWTGAKAISGTLSVVPTVTSTYSLTCTGAGGTSPVASATVTVTAALPTTMPATPTYSCPAQMPPAPAYVLSGSSCNRAAYTIPTYTQSATLSYYCAYGGNPWYGYYSGTYGYFCYGSGPGIAAIYGASSHYTCPAGSTGPSAGNLCTFPAVNVPASTITATVSSYSCLSGYTLSGSICNITVAPPPPPPPIIASCNASPLSAAIGTSVTYTATASGGTSSYTYSWSGTDTLSGTSISVSKSYTTAGAKTATVTVTSGTQTTSTSCNTTIRPPNAVLVLPWTGPLSVVAGQPLTYTLNWNGGPMTASWSTFEHFIKSDDPNISFGDGFWPSPATTQWSGNVATTRTFTVPAGTPLGTYKVMAGLYSGSTRVTTLVAGSGVTADTQNRYQVGTVTVTAAPPPAVPTVTLTATYTSITSGQSSTLTWSSTNATSCTASGVWTGVKATSGTLAVTPTVTSTYSLTCTGAGGTSPVTSMAITIRPPNAVLVLPWTGPLSVVAGQPLTYTLNWNGGPMTASWSTFEHFIKSDDPNISFGDGFWPSPATTQWSGNVATTRTFTVPAGTPLGTYKVMAGLYSGSTRVTTLVAGSGVTADTQNRYQVGTVTVSAAPISFLHELVASVLDAISELLNK